MSSISPHASPPSSKSSGSGSGKKESLADGADGGGDLRAWRWRVDAEEDVAGVGRLGGGADGPPLAGTAGDEEGWISPAAAESLLVKEEMAQPAHPAAAAADDSAGCGVDILGPPPPAAAMSGGSAVSGMPAAAFLIFAM